MLAPGDRIASYEVMSYLIGEVGEMGTPIGMYNTTLHQYTAYGHTVVWPGNVTKVPAGYIPGTLPLATNYQRMTPQPPTNEFGH